MSEHFLFETEHVAELAKKNPQDLDFTAAMSQVRPKSFEDYPGQQRVCENLKVYTQASLTRGRPMDHCLFYGPPGLGKTTLAGIIAHTMGATMRVTSGPVVEKAADLMGLLAGLEPFMILFIDEIHRLPANVEEILYTAMEDSRIDVLVGQGPSARTVKLELPPFTLIGATTRPGAVSAPLRDRFGILEHLEYYKPEDLQKIIERSASILGYNIDPLAALTLAKRCRGTPRIANVLLRRVMDFALVAGESVLEVELMERSLNRLGIDEFGFSRLDRHMMRIMRDRYLGGPVGLEAVAASLNEERHTLEDVHEPYLVYAGFIIRTARGRCLSPLALESLKKIEDVFGSEF